MLDWCRAGSGLHGHSQGPSIPAALIALHATIHALTTELVLAPMAQEEVKTGGFFVFQKVSSFQTVGTSSTV